MDAIIADPSTSIGSDQLGVTTREARVHPRAYGTFVARARPLRARAGGAGPADGDPPDDRPAGRRALGLTDRGRIAPGAVADLVLFDPTTVADASTYEDPTRAAIGVEAVLLGGAFAVDGGQPVRPSLGRVLRPEVSGPRRPPRSG